MFLQMLCLIEGSAVTKIILSGGSTWYESTVGCKFNANAFWWISDFNSYWRKRPGFAPQFQFFYYFYFEFLLQDYQLVKLGLILDTQEAHCVFNKIEQYANVITQPCATHLLE